ncbi:MAG: DUF167 domain-containing protein [Gemmatimonadales bacterium]
MTARLTVHVVPRAAETAVAGRHGDAVRIRVAAAPADGAANDELVRFLAERLGVPRRAVAIAAGDTSRRKRLTIDGLDSAEVLRRLGV